MVGASESKTHSLRKSAVNVCRLLEYQYAPW
jgi:hypothetical protein